MGASRANRAAFEADALDWREDAKTNPKDMTIFYFSGHGMQRGPDDGVLMLEDFLAPGGKLNKCFEVSDLKAGMAPSETFRDIALTQFYFIDACMAREAVQTKFVNLTVPEVFSAELNSSTHGGLRSYSAPSMARFRLASTASRAISPKR